MSDASRDHQEEPGRPTGQAPPDRAAAAESATARVTRTRISAAWMGVCAAALALIVLIIFIAQNTRRVQVSFLWLDGTVPLALALLIAAVASAVVAAIIGTARITQLRRRITREQH